MKKNVILLGGSGISMRNALHKGLEIGGGVVVNLALGGTTCLQNLYELNRKRNQEILKNADLIISNSNTGDIGARLFWKQNMQLEQIYRYLSWLFKSLYFLNKKILIFDLPFLCHTDKINEEKQYYNLNKKLCNQYGFNYINLREYYKFNDLEEFGKRYDGGGHEFEFVMR